MAGNSMRLNPHIQYYSTVYVVSMGAALLLKTMRGLVFVKVSHPQPFPLPTVTFLLLLTSDEVIKWLWCLKGISIHLLALPLILWGPWRGWHWTRGRVHHGHVTSESQGFERNTKSWYIWSLHLAALLPNCLYCHSFMLSLFQCYNWKCLWAKSIYLSTTTSHRVTIAECVCLCEREGDNEMEKKEGCMCVRVSGPSGGHPLFQSNPSWHCICRG